MSRRGDPNYRATFEAYFHFHSLDSLLIEEELSLMVAEAEGREPIILKRREWNKDATRHAGCPDLTKEDEA